MNKTDEAIAGLIDKVQHLAPQAWDLAIRQAKIDGIENLVLMVAMIALFWTSVYFIKYAYKKAKYGDDWDIPAYIFGTIGCIFGFILSLVAATEALDALANPGFYALHLLIKGGS